MARSPSSSKGKSHANTILDYAKTYAAEKGYQFGRGADDYMRQHAANAASQIDVLPKSKQNTQLRKALDNFAALVDEMIEAADTIPGYKKAHPGSIGEDTLTKALRTICPLWPFC